MSNLTSTARAKIVTATNPTIYNLSMPLANNEYPQALSPSTKKVMIRMRTPAECKVAFILGDSGTLYFTIKSGAVYYEENLDLNGVTIYLRSSVSGQVAEILEWV